jgi:nucleoside-diphosphate-sugar epimerase
MALFLFTRAVLAGEPIKVFNHGKMRRDFTYIDDTVEGVVRVMANLLARAEVLYTLPPSHNCLRPVAPFQFTSQRQKKQYRKDVQAYMNCLKQFVEDQKEAIRRHQETIRRQKEVAEEAIEEWNSFAKGLKGLKQIFTVATI